MQITYVWCRLSKCRLSRCEGSQGKKALKVWALDVWMIYVCVHAEIINKVIKYRAHSFEPLREHCESRAL